MRRILVIAGFRDSVFRFRGQLINELRNRGLEVHVAAPGLEPSRSANERFRERGVIPHNISFDRAGVGPLSDLRAALQLVKLMRGLRPDVCLSYTVKPNIYGILAAWACRVPNRVALVTGLGYVFTNNRRGVLYRLIRRMYSASLRRASIVFFQNADDRTLFFDEGILGRDSNTFVVNGSGVDLVEYPYSPVTEERPAFLMIARLLGDKGVREYARAASLVRARYPDARFAVAGWLDDNPDSISQVELDDWLESGHVEYLGRLDDVRDAIAESSVYVLPSYREGTPRTVLEAMAMGRPIITTDAPGCRETVR